MEAWYAAAVREKKHSSLRAGTTVHTHSLFWGVSQPPTKCGYRVTCFLHKAKFLGWYL